jgi:hypothetical protein
VKEQEEVHEEEETAPEPAEASLDEILAKKEEAAAPEEEGEEESVLSAAGSDRVETLTVKVVPPQPTEFVCKKCFLVKHRSQLADKKRMICRDCAAH